MPHGKKDARTKCHPRNILPDEMPLANRLFIMLYRTVDGGNCLLIVAVM